MNDDVDNAGTLSVLGLTPRDVKLALRDGRVMLRPGQPRIAEECSEFQKKRIRAWFPLVSRYLRGGKTVTQLAEESRVTHQRISQILTLGVRFLIRAGHIVPAKKNGDGAVQLGSGGTVQGG